MKLLNSKRVDFCLSSCPSAPSQPCEEWSCAEGVRPKTVFLQSVSQRRLWVTNRRRCVRAELQNARFFEDACSIYFSSGKRYGLLNNCYLLLVTCADKMTTRFSIIEFFISKASKWWSFVEIWRFITRVGVSRCKNVFFLFIYLERRYLELQVYIQKRRIPKLYNYAKHYMKGFPCS